MRTNIPQAIHVPAWDKNMLCPILLLIAVGLQADITGACGVTVAWHTEGRQLQARAMEEAGRSVSRVLVAQSKGLGRHSKHDHIISRMIGDVADRTFRRCM